MVMTVNNIAYDLKHGLKTDIYYPNDTDSQTKILILWHGVRRRDEHDFAEVVRDFEISVAEGGILLGV